MKCESSKCTRASGYAIRKVFFGDTDRTGAANQDAWKTYGRNLDGITSAGLETGDARSCKPVAGSPSTHHADGDNGIDNSFGRNILPLLAPFFPNPSASMTTLLEQGARTNLLQLTAWEPPFESDPSVNTSFLRSEKLGAAKWDGTDIRDTVPVPGVPSTGQVYSAAIDDGLYASKATSTSSGTSGFKYLDLDLGFGGGTTVLVRLDSPLITMRISPDSNAATEGMFSGFIKVADLEKAVAELLGRSSKDLCSGPTLEAIKQGIRQAADVLAEDVKPPVTTDAGGIVLDSGTVDPTKECDAISFGMGFEAGLVVVGRKRAADPTPSDPCAP